MTTLNLNTEYGNRKKAAIMNFCNTKRFQWNRYRRYGF